MAVLPSPAVERAARVLQAVAAEPSGELSLSEVARRIGVHRASCQSLLLALCAQGLLVRGEPGARYRLGPALVELGDRARGEIDVGALTDSTVAELAGRFDASAFAGIVAGNQILVASARQAPHPFGIGNVAGGRIPFRAPVGLVYVAWASRPVLEGWLGRAEPALSARRRVTLEGELGLVRERGWSATVRAPGETARRRPDHREVTHDDLTADRLTVIGVSAPVWDRHDALVCSLALTWLPDDVSGRRLLAIARAVQSAATALTDALRSGSPNLTAVEGS